MRIGTSWIWLIGAIDALSVSPISNDEVSQAVLSKKPNSADVIEADPPEIIIGQNPPEIIIDQNPPETIIGQNPPQIIIGQAFDDGKAYAAADGTPVISPPQNGREKGDRLNCTYPRMHGWKSCHGPESRGCWLQKLKGNKTIDINTNYEIPEEVPYGIVRRFSMTVDEQPISPDGVTMEHGKVFNRTYPGPWIEACWGDWLEITVTNKLRWNGTSVHWHGIRQLKTNQHDGVNGITECPIPPGGTFTYKFRALQYGSAWYHSHYSLQYGDGLLGPLTIYGPSTANYAADDTFRPILMTDWNHRSVFEDWPIMIEEGLAPEMTNILLNGTGQFGPGKSNKEKYQITFEPGKQHMLILVNTAVDTTFVFSIDNHNLTVIAMDFVPIEPYTTDHIKIGISQRYHVVVNGFGNPKEHDKYGNFWMRVVPARKCSKFAYGPDEQMGIVRYKDVHNNTNKKDPLSDPQLYDIACADEPMEKLKPRLKWTVGNATNIDATWTDETEIPMDKSYIFEVAMDRTGKNKSEPYPDSHNPNGTYRWKLHEAPLWINFSEPTILNLDKTDWMTGKPHLDFVSLDDQEEDEWIWLVIFTQEKPDEGSRRRFIPAAHPIHLHGHDFALLAQSKQPWDDVCQDEGDICKGEKHKLTPDKLNCANPYFNCDNPPRRDSVLLPAGGFVVIAFKADNPGAWIMHCHIAFHASSGMAMQILENKHRIDYDSSGDRKEMEKNCEEWRNWRKVDMNLWDPERPDLFQDDSGV